MVAKRLSSMQRRGTCMPPIGRHLRRPQVTYGKRMKPLPLRGTHFQCPDQYDVSSTDESETSKPVTSYERRCRRNIDPDAEWDEPRSQRRQKEPGLNDSPLTEDALCVVCGIEPVETRARSRSKTRGEALETSRYSSPAADEELHRLKAPLTTIRKRLKTPKLIHKSVIALRKKQCIRAPFFKPAAGKRGLGDGFEATELKSGSAPASQNHRTSKPPIIGLAPLILKSGPLPAVNFHTSRVELKTELQRYDRTPAVITTAPVRSLSRQAPVKYLNRSFSGLVDDEVIMAQLSSVSAPARHYSISSDDGEDDDRRDDDWHMSSSDKVHELTEEGEDDEDEDEDDAEQDGEDRSASRSSPSDHSATEISLLERSRQPEVPVNLSILNSAVTVDSRNPKFGRESRVHFKRQRLMEVDDVILDDSYAKQPLPSTVTSPSQLPPDAFHEHALSGPLGRPKRQHQAPRSILRRCTPSFPNAETRPEDTAANTRRNSQVYTYESRHFTGATTNGPSMVPSPRCHAQHSRVATDIHMDEVGSFAPPADKLRPSALSASRITKPGSTELRRSALLAQGELL